MKTEIFSAGDLLPLAAGSLEINAADAARLNAMVEYQFQAYQMHPAAATPFTVPGYESLADVLERAYNQAAIGKGKERHANALPFHRQPMQRLCDMYGTGFALGQASKKAEESQVLPHERAVAELLGAIVYLAGAVIHLEKQP